MEKIKILFAHRIFKIFKWVFLILVGIFILMEVVRFPFKLQEQKTVVQVAKIHATKLTLDDVMGKNLPPDPGANADKTVAGIDANTNGIRDDVELAIFNTYPTSAKTRAVLLQYALALQMEFTQPIINTTTATEVLREYDRASICVADTLVPGENSGSGRSEVEMEKIKTYIDFIDRLQINTKERNIAQSSFYKNLRSYNSLNQICDIDYSTLPN
jgi:hypothetical protein